MQWKHLFVWGVAFAATGARADVCMFGDGDGDADVDFVDFAAFQICFSGPGGAAGTGCEPFDFDADGDVDLHDFSDYGLTVTGPTPALDYGASPRDNPEAEQLALEHFDSLLADDAVYERILRDLAAIRALEPNVATVIHDPAWLADEMIVKVTSGVATCGFDAMNAFYQVTDIEFLFKSGGGTWYVLHFPGRMRIPLLGTFYAALPEVQFADPNFLIGTDDDIDIFTGGGGTWTYSIDDGFHDCFDGCDCHVFWSFSVDADGDATLLSMQCSGASWCTFPDFCGGG